MFIFSHLFFIILTSIIKYSVRSVHVVPRPRLVHKLKRLGRESCFFFVWHTYRNERLYCNMRKYIGNWILSYTMGFNPLPHTFSTLIAYFKYYFNECYYKIIHKIFWILNTFYFNTKDIIGKLMFLTFLSMYKPNIRKESKIHFLATFPTFPNTWYGK